MGRTLGQRVRSRTVRLSKQLFAQLVRDDALGLAAELAYRFFLAIFPFFVFLASVGQVTVVDYLDSSP